MDIHKPKPWHGSPELLKEIGTIVIGVLIALAGEQGVEALHSRHLVGQAEAAMRAEIVDDDGAQAYARLAVGPCLSRELDDLRNAMDHRLAPEAFGRLAASYEPPHRTWDEGAWKAAESAGVLSRMGSTKLHRWSVAYDIVPGLGAVARLQTEVLARLKLTRFRSGAWTQARADELSDIIDNLDTINRRMAVQAAQQIFNMKESGLELSANARKSILTEAKASYGACVVEPDLRAIEVLQGQLYSPEQRALVSGRLVGR
jgi:hypothetical protein